ncbi:hypothetical protein [Vibrio furnissii]|uniref:hypothetical protein n=1 Tax=Vibrio furnissii TaxID=29494 RepID=UPI001EEADD41|nr:hypothetical protein [Vibrio furnissii]MCG6231559.1 hypothetical protein [Vibrio furnissii]MCG6261484.1 hypothetical protein [Vibrio furnissii]
MRLAVTILFITILLFGFVIGTIIGVEVVEVSVAELPSKTMYSFVVENASLLGSFSSFLALILALGLYIGWKKQQHEILQINQKREILERLARLASNFRLHMMTTAFKDEENKFFEEKLFEQILELMESITVYYALSGFDEDLGTFADHTVQKHGDFLDETKIYYQFVSNYLTMKKTGCFTIDRDRVGYNKNNINNELCKELFKGAESDEYYLYLPIAQYTVAVNRQFGKAAKNIKQQISKVV